MIELSTHSHWTLVMRNLDFGDDSLDSSDANGPNRVFHWTLVMELQLTSFNYLKTLDRKTRHSQKVLHN